MKIFDRFLHKIEEFVSKLTFLYTFLKKCKVKYQSLKYRLLKRRSDCIDVMFDKSFFDKNLEWNTPIAEKLAELVIKYFNPKSIVDVGCGNAEFLSEFKKKDIAIKGYEGSRHALENSLVDRKFVEQFDLRQRIKPQQRYDLALCLEVAEHIEESFSQNLVDNLTDLSDSIIFTAASPGQGGQFHINEQKPEFWIDIFNAQNFIYDREATKKIKAEMKKEEILWWYHENLMVFKKSQNDK